MSIFSGNGFTALLTFPNSNNGTNSRLTLMDKNAAPIDERQAISSEKPNKDVTFPEKRVIDGATHPNIINGTMNNII